MLNYQMNKVANTIPELINMLKTTEEAVAKQSSKSVMVVSLSTSYKGYRKKMKRKKTTDARGGVSKKGKQVLLSRLLQERGLPQKACVSIAVGPVIGNTTARPS